MGRTLLIYGGVNAEMLDKLLVSAQAKANSEARKIDEIRRALDGHENDFLVAGAVSAPRSERGGNGNPARARGSRIGGAKSGRKQGGRGEDANRIAAQAGGRASAADGIIEAVAEKARARRTGAVRRTAL